MGLVWVVVSFCFCFCFGAAAQHEETDRQLKGRFETLAATYGVQRASELFNDEQLQRSQTQTKRNATTPHHFSRALNCACGTTMFSWTITAGSGSAQVRAIGSASVRECRTFCCAAARSPSRRPYPVGRHISQAFHRAHPWTCFQQISWVPTTT